MFGRDLICEHSLLFLKFQKPPEEEKKKIINNKTNMQQLWHLALKKLIPYYNY